MFLKNTKNRKMSRVDGTRKTVFFSTIKIIFLLFRTAGVFRVPWSSEEYKVKEHRVPCTCCPLPPYNVGKDLR